MVRSTEELTRFMNELLLELNHLLGSKVHKLVLANHNEKDNFFRASPIDSEEKLYIAVSTHGQASFLALAAMNYAVGVVREHISGEGALPLLTQEGVELSSCEYAAVIYDELCQLVINHFEECAQFKFPTIDRLSCMSYEGSRLEVKLAFLPTGTLETFGSLLSVKFGAREQLELKMSNLRQIRKVAAGADIHGLLLCYESDSYRCCGYMNGFSESEIFPYAVVITGIYNWTFYVEGLPFFRVEHGKLKVWQDRVESAVEALREEFSINKPNVITGLRNAIKGIAEQRHGTAAIFLDFSDPVSKEAIKRLTCFKRAIPLSGEHKLIGRGKIQPDALTALSAIDGATIINIKEWSVTHIATIVDGIAVVEGSLDRGARHNSISTFMANLKEDNPNLRAVAAIFSEDGDITIIKS